MTDVSRPPAAQNASDDEGAPWTWVVLMVIGLAGVLLFLFWKTSTQPEADVPDPSPSASSSASATRPMPVVVTKTGTADADTMDDQPDDAGLPSATPTRAAQNHAKGHHNAPRPTEASSATPKVPRPTAKTPGD